MKQLKLSELERVAITTALCVTMVIAKDTSHNGAMMRLAKKILNSLAQTKRSVNV